MAMTLSAVMNLTGNFAAQLQANVKAAQEMAQQAKQAGDAIRNSFSENIGQKLSSGLSMARDAFGAAGVASAGFLKQCVDGAANAEKVNADLAQTIKSTGGAAGLTAGQVADMANSLSQATTFSKGTIEAGQNMLLTFTNIGKDVFPQATQSLVDLATKMKSDPSSAAIQLGKALNDPTTGLTALTRVGITFNDQQKEQIKTMQAAGDVAGAQKIMLTELNKEFGGQAQAAAQTYDGQMKQLANTFASVKGAIGSAILPYLLQVAQKLNEGAKEVANFVKEHKNLVAVILSVTAVFGTLIGGASLFTHLSSFFGPTVQQIIKYLKDLPIPIMAIVGAISLLVAAYTTNFMGFKDLVDGVIGTIVSAFKSATDTFKNTGDIIQSIGVFIKGVFGDEVANAVTSTLTLIKTIVMSLIDTIKAHMPEIKAVISSVFQGIQIVWNSVLKPVLLFVIETFADVVNWINANFPSIESVMISTFNSIKDKINSFMDAIKNANEYVKEHKKQIEDVATVLGVIFAPALIKVGTEATISGAKMTAQFVSAIVKSGVEAVVAGAKMTASFISAVIKMGIESAATGIKISVSLVGSLISFAAQGWSTVASIVAMTAAWIAQKAIMLGSIAVTGLMTAAQWAFNTSLYGCPVIWIVAAIMAIIAVGVLLYTHWDEVKAKALELWDNIKSTFSHFGDLANQALQWGKDMIDGFISGIKSKIDAIGDAAKGVAEKIKSFLHFSVPDVGPLELAA